VKIIIKSNSKKQMKKYNILLIVMVLILQSCIKEVTDAANIKDIKVNGLDGVYAIPVANSKVKLADLIANRNEKKYIQVNSEGFLSAIFDTVAQSLDISEFIKIPNISNKINLPIIISPDFVIIPDGTEITLINQKRVSESISVRTNELDQIKFEQGTLKFDFSNYSSHTIIYDITINDLKSSSNTPYSFTKVLTPNIGSSSSTLDLKNYTWDFTSNNTSYNKLEMTVSVKINKNGYNYSPNLGFNVSIENINYNEITGFFNETYYPFYNVLPIDMFKNSQFNGTLEIEKPLIKIEFENDFQTPFEILLTGDEASIKYANNPPESLTGLSFPIILQSAPTSTIPYKKTIEFGSSISPNIGTIISKNPTELSFRFVPIIGPTLISQRHILRRSDRIRVKTSMELPLKLKAKNFIIDQYINAQISDIKNRDSIIDKVEIKMILNNAFPFDNNMQIEVLDPTNGNSVLKKLLPAGSMVLKGGSVGSPTSSVNYITISGSEWTNWASKGVNQFRITHNLSTTKAGSTFEVIKDDQFVEAIMGVKLYLKARF
jgi:hypothetical protein